MATDIIARGMAAGVVSQVSADKQAVSEDRAAVETAKTEVLNVAESIPEDYSTLSADVSELKGDLGDLQDALGKKIGEPIFTTKFTSEYKKLTKIQMNTPLKKGTKYTLLLSGVTSIGTIYISTLDDNNEFIKEDIVIFNKENAEENTDFSADIISEKDVYYIQFYTTLNPSIQLNFKCGVTKYGSVIDEHDDRIIEIDKNVSLIKGETEYKNLIKLNDEIITINGIDYNLTSSDGTVKTSGISSIKWSKLTVFNIVPSETSDYYFSGCPLGGSTSTTSPNYNMSLWGVTENSIIGIDSGNGFVANLQANNKYVFSIQFGPKINADNLIFKPMCVKGNVVRDFIPYVYDIKEIEKDILAIQNPISILELGGKNDGSEDIGAIINANTIDKVIYLPCGKYLVTTPIKLVNSLIGQNNIRYEMTFENSIATTIISGISTGNLIETVSTTANAITLSDFNILCNGDENAVVCNSKSRVRISNVSINNLGNATGILTIGRYSRHVYADNISIFANQNKNSVGIDFTSSIDCRLTNIEIMYCQVGIKLNELHMLSNVHIWTGSNADITKEWYDKTIGIHIGGRGYVNANNLYVDSAFNLIKFDAGGRMWVTNLMMWDDGTGSDLESIIHFTQKGGTAYLWVNGGLYNNSRITVDTDNTNVLTNFVRV